MPAALRLTHEHRDQVERFLAARRAAGRAPSRSTERAARTFCARLERAGGFERMSLSRQVEAVARAPAFAAWLMVSGRLRVSAELLVGADLRQGVAARNYLPAVHGWFVDAAERLGASPADISLQWSTLAKITALSGVAPDAIADAEFDAARAQILGAFSARARPSSGRNPAACFHRLRLTLYHAGRLRSHARPTGREPLSKSGWGVVAPGFAQAARRYVAQVALSLRPSTVAHIGRPCASSAPGSR